MELSKGHPDGSKGDRQFCLNGRNLTPQNVLRLEKKLVQNPSEIVDRLMLLGYYESRVTGSSRAADAYERHAIWLIKNRPADWISGTFQLSQFSTQTFAVLRRVWSEHVKQSPADPRILGNAAMFLSPKEPKLAKQLFHTAKELDPHNPAWPRILAGIYRFQAIHGLEENRAKFGESAFEYGDLALTLEHELGERYGLLVSLCELAIDFGQLKRAERYVKHMSALAAKHKYPHWRHKVLTCKGRIEIRTGNCQGAKRMLRLTSKLESDFPDLKFDQNQRLAAEVRAIELS